MVKDTCRWASIQWGAPSGTRTPNPLVKSGPFSGPSRARVCRILPLSSPRPALVVDRDHPGSEGTDTVEAAAEENLTALSSTFEHGLPQSRGVADDRPRLAVDVEVLVAGPADRAVDHCVHDCLLAGQFAFVAGQYDPVRSPGRRTRWPGSGIRSMIFARCPAGSGRPVRSLRATRSPFVRKAGQRVHSSWGGVGDQVALPAPGAVEGRRTRG
jgi:hypothetical protein